MSRPARWECESCHRLLAEIEHGRRVFRSVSHCAMLGAYTRSVPAALPTPGD